MFKFLVYLFLFYIVSKFIFGTLLNFKQNTTANNYDNEPADEGELKIKTKPKPTTKTKPNQGNSNLGEYVDFEEIK